MRRWRLTKETATANLFTHNGVFHADDLFGAVIAAKALGLEEVAICRTREIPENLGEDIIVFDVGFGKFDHHQRGGNGARENGVPYAASGLLWKEFGPQIVSETCNPEFVWQLIDSELIQSIDALDNGIKLHIDETVKTMSLTQMFSLFNPNWDSEETFDEQFLAALPLAEMVFDTIFAMAKAVGERILLNTTAEEKAVRLVEEAIEKAENNILILDQFMPWQKPLFESENAKAAEILMVVWADNGSFRWQCVPDQLGGFGQRKPVPAQWKGLRGEALQEVTGVATATFCHPGGFTGGAGTLEDVLKLAKMAVEA